MAKKADNETKPVENGAGGPAASQMPLFYKNPVPLDAKKHSSLGLKKDFGLGFTEGINAVPVNLIEMPQICHFYPIAFSPDGKATPVAILGLRDNENLFLNADGSWDPGSYIPAYIRRYPFIFSEIPNTEQLTLCVDIHDGVTEENSEQGFFEAEGAPTKLATDALEFCKSYHAAAEETMAFSQALAECDLLIDRAIKIKVHGNKEINFSGFQLIDEEKFSKLSDKKFLEFRKERPGLPLGWLPSLYAQLFSVAQWQRLTNLLNQRLEKEAA